MTIDAIWTLIPAMLLIVSSVWVSCICLRRATQIERELGLMKPTEPPTMKARYRCKQS